MVLLLELKPCRTPCSGVVVCAGISAGLLGKGPAVLGPRQSFPRRTECKGVGPGVSKLGSQHWHFTVY